MIAGTPGPWRLDDGGRSVVAGDDGDARIAAVKLGFGVNKIDERNANAALIAAAPTLADALERLLDAQTGVNMGDLAGALTEARDALRAAGRLPGEAVRP